MSSFLYRLGRDCYRHGKRVLALWLAVLAVLGGLALGVGGTYSDSFKIPGAPSQVALDKLDLTFPDAAATSASAILVVPAGHKVTDADEKAAITRAIKLYRDDPIVQRVTGPFDRYATGMTSKDGRAAMVQVELTKGLMEVTDADRDRLKDITRQVQDQLGAGATTSIGGQPFSVNVPSMSVTEALGLVVALVVLFLTLGSLLAAGLPLLTAVWGVGISMLLIMLAAGFTEVSSTTPMLAVMLGLAVGIDYALFILSRHREQLRHHDGRPPMDTEESAAQAVATSGSAVVFAGVTVCIALAGLGLARIPFLTSMGIFAALAVATAVAIALTALPALMGLLGERMRPRSRRRQRPAGRGRPSPTDWWVRTATRLPVLTIAVVAVGLGALALPASKLWLALPNAGQSQPGTSARTTYDLTTEHFGPGYNGPLIVTADLLGSTDPLGVMNNLKKDILATPGVASVLLASPNRNADTGIVQVVPTTAPDDPATGRLVERLVGDHDDWQRRYGTNTAVTGNTAIQIDISSQLARALLPFGVFVVGLSAVLLMMVFRSIWVPVTAALGFVLSVVAAFGTTQLVFNRGIGASLINLDKASPIISFMPIIIMGILFGLAMDYEVFLVSRMREDYVHALREHPEDDRGLLARRAIRSGFNGSAVVVTAAAVIMFSVFAFFVPEGEGPIKQIAFGLAVGVAVDAFLVRMTLVPAVMQLLGARAWRLPAWLDKRLPLLDVEGEGLHQELELGQWPTAEHTEALHAEGVAVDGVLAPVDLHAEPGQLLVVQGTHAQRRALALALSGRLALSQGRARVAGDLVTEQAGRVRLHTAVVQAGPNFSHQLRLALGRDPRVVFVEGADQLVGADREELLQAIGRSRQQRDRAFVLGVHEAGEAPDVVLHAPAPPVPAAESGRRTGAGSFHDDEDAGLGLVTSGHADGR